MILETSSISHEARLGGSCPFNLARPVNSGGKIYLGLG